MNYFFSFISKIVTPNMILKDRKRSPNRIPGRGDRWVFISIILLSIIGLLSVYESSVAIALRDFSDQYYYVKEQIQWFIAGFIVMIAASFIDYRHYRAVSFPFFVISMIFLLAVFLPGIGVKAYGAHRWIDVGFINFQPAEIAKLSFILYLSAWLSGEGNKKLLPFFLLLSVIVGLIVIEPDLGTAIVVLATGLLLYFFSGAPLFHFWLIAPVVLSGVLLFVFIAPYRVRRLMTFLNPESDPLGASYQIRQILLALGSGNLFGVGIGRSRQKYTFLPEANTDSIFAIIGEEIGFIGSTIVIGIFLFLLWRGYRVAAGAPDSFGRLLALGISSWIGVQTAINLSSTVALIPLTGVPLPFISYGGSSLIVFFASIGILLNVSKHSRR